MSRETFAEMSPARRAYAVEDYRHLLRRLCADGGHPLDADRPLSRETAALLSRLQCALVDSSCSTASYQALDKASFEAVADEEADELRRRLDQFVAIRDRFPLYAGSAEEALAPMVEKLRRRFGVVE